ncbi:MAG: CPBP family intramembrane metalloprotease [Oscillospiraceae bacterium]|nr:CPBP family intramembrane metalloprotease [Oscillospiraceae bacterium]
MLQDMTADESRSRFRRILFRLAVFCVIALVNQKLLFRVIFFPAQLWYAYYGQQASYDTVYFVNWLVSDISSYLVPALAAFLLFRRERAPVPRQEGFRVWAEMPLVFFSACFAGSIASFIAKRISEILDRLFGTGEIPDAMAGSLPDDGQSGSAWIFILFVVIIAPVCEELIFRKLLLQPLRGCGDMFAAVASAFIFGAIHGNFDQFPYAFAVGLLYGILAVRSSSVLPTLALHFANNLLVTASLYLTDMVGSEAEWAVQAEEWAALLVNLSFWLGIPALVLMAVLGMFRLRREGQMTARELFAEPAVYVCLVGTAVMLI